METETEPLRKNLTQAQYDLKCANDHLQQKEKEHEEKNKKNVELMKKYIQDNNRLRESLHKCATKVKELEQKSEHAHAVASEEPEASREAKRLECTNLSSIEKEDL